MAQETNGISYDYGATGNQQPMLRKRVSKLKLESLLWWILELMRHTKPVPLGNRTIVFYSRNVSTNAALTGLEVLVEHAAINIASLQD